MRRLVLLRRQASRRSSRGEAPWSFGQHKVVVSHVSQTRISVESVAQVWGPHLVVFHGEVQDVIKSVDSCWGLQAQGAVLR